MKITTCIFDLDGVIVDTAKYHYLAWKRLAKEKFNKDFSIHDNEQLKGVSRVESLNILLGICGKDVPENEKQQLTDLKNKWYVEYITRITPDEILPGVLKKYNFDRKCFKGTDRENLSEFAGRLCYKSGYKNKKNSAFRLGYFNRTLLNYYFFF